MSVRLCYRITDNIKITKVQLSTTLQITSTATVFVLEYWLFSNELHIHIIYKCFIT